MPISDEMRKLVEVAGVSRFDLGKLAGAGVYVPSETYDATVAARDALLTAIEKLEAERDRLNDENEARKQLIDKLEKALGEIATQYAQLHKAGDIAQRALEGW